MHLVDPFDLAGEQPLDLLDALHPSSSSPAAAGAGRGRSERKPVKLVGRGVQGEAVGCKVGREEEDVPLLFLGGRAVVVGGGDAVRGRTDGRRGRAADDELRERGVVRERARAVEVRPDAVCEGGEPVGGRGASGRLARGMQAAGCERTRRTSRTDPRPSVGRRRPRPRRQTSASRARRRAPRRPSAGGRTCSVRVRTGDVSPVRSGREQRRGLERRRTRSSRSPGRRARRGRRGAGAGRAGSPRRR